MCGHPVITEELVFTNQLFTELHIVLGSGIACCLQGHEPVVIVSRRITSATLIAVSHQQPRMMVDALLDGGIVTELLFRLVIVMKAIRSALGQPLRTTLDTEIVIALTC